MTTRHNVVALLGPSGPYMSSQPGPYVTSLSCLQKRYYVRNDIMCANNVRNNSTSNRNQEHRE